MDNLEELDSRDTAPYSLTFKWRSVRQVYGEDRLQP